ncbi:hypothetical protein ACH5RR_004498 [Cinchona calisaya]|uniref:Late embryogenesis abundant protein LEA-2 subgroup domain-containing protein n=1 Tax=Cinchona calisaya TaxID=153742 RepID=A0ABD3AYN2_9GENT
MAAASSSDSRFVMGYPSTNNNNNNNNNKYPHPPVPGYALPMQPGAYPPPQPPYNGYLGDALESKKYGSSSFNVGANYPPPQQPYINAYQGGMVESKKYSTPSFNVWYNSRNYRPSGWSFREDDSGKKFGRVMLVTMVTLIVCMCMVSLVIWFLFGTESPEFNVASLAVSNLNVSESVITANWDVNVTVFNPNTDLKVNFTSVKASIFYKNYPLAMSAIEPFYLQGTHLHKFQIRLDNEKAMAKPLLVEEINRSQRGGVLYLSVRMSLGAKFQSNSIWRKETLRVFCDDLKLNFPPTGANGIMAEDLRTECLVFT